MKTIKNLTNVTPLSNEEKAILKGGDRIYKIGDRVVTKDEYKAAVLDATGRPSAN